MGKQEKARNPGHESSIHTTAKRLTVLLAFIAAVYGVISTLFGPHAKLGWISLAAAVLLIVAASQHHRIGRALHRVREGMRHKMLRRIPLAFSVILIALGAWMLTHPSPRRTVVLVADFADRQEEGQWRVTDSILNSLHRALDCYPDIVVKPLGRQITEREGSAVARSEGKRYRAMVVIWGSYSATRTTAMAHVHVELAKPITRILTLRPAQSGQPRRLPVSKLDSYEFQVGLSNEMASVALFTAGAVSQSRGRYSEAAIRYGRAIEVSDTRSSINLAPAYAQRASCYVSQGEWHRAIMDCDKAIRLDPNVAEPYCTRALAYHMEGDDTKALADLGTAIRLDPSRPDAYLNRAQGLSDRGQFDSAIADYSKAIDLGWDDAEIHYWRAVAFHEKGDLAAAVKDYDKAIQLDPKFHLAYRQRGTAYYDSHQPERAVLDYSRALSLNRHDAVSYYNRGTLYYASGDFARTIRDYTCAIEINPSWAAPYYNRGIAYWAIGDKGQALNDYDKAMSLDPTLSKPPVGSTARELKIKPLPLEGELWPRR